jgi:hypothetical protein
LEQAQLVARAFGDPEPGGDEVFAAKKSETQPPETNREKSNRNPKET